MIVIINTRGLKIPDANLARDIQPLCTKVKMHPKKITLSVTWVNNGYVPQGSRTNLGSENGLLDWQNF